MYVVIGGAGDAGITLGRFLRSQGHEIAFIERDRVIAKAAGQLDALVIEGNACDPKVLREAEISRSDYYAGLVTEDSSNLTSCSLANYHGCETIARVKSSSLASEPFSRAYAHIGVDVVLCPALIAASQITRVFAFPSKLRLVKKWGISPYHAVVEAGSMCCSEALGDMELPAGCRVISIFRGVEHLLPVDSLILQPEDEILILVDERTGAGPVQDILGVKMDEIMEIHDVFVAGITDVGLTLSRRLLNDGISVSIMSLDRLRLQEAAENLPGATAIQADPLGQGILRREGIEKFDVLLATGPNIERNILTGVLAKQFGVPRVLSLVDRIDLKNSVEKTLVDDVVVPNLLLVKTVMDLIVGEGHLRNRSLQTRNIAVRDITLSGKARCLGKTVRDFSPSLGDFLIGAVQRKGRGYVPENDFVLVEGDRLMVLYPTEGYDTVKRWLLG